MRSGPDPPSDTTMVRQAWWKRVGVWLGALFVLQGLFGLRSSYASDWVAYLALGAGMVAFVAGWRQGVLVTDQGIETRRLARRRNRTASWTDIERFEGKRAPVAVLRDGSTVTLFDWAGDGEAMLARLEAERRARGAPSTRDDSAG